MNAKEIYFVTKNPFKKEEFTPLFQDVNVSLVEYEYDIHEIQTDNMDSIIRDKVRKAFARVRRPVMVDHSGLALNALGGLPKGLTQLFWDTLKESGVCRLVEAMASKEAEAIISLGFCDGKTIHIEHEKLRGEITPEPRGARSFQWDRIFVPEGSHKTYSEMEIEEKNSLSQRAKAARKLITYLQWTRFTES